MTILASLVRPLQSRPLTPTLFERVLAIGAAIMFVIVVTALVRGYAHWREVPVLVWMHLLTIIIALALTPFLLLGPRGNRQHRQLGYIWVVSMAATAALSFGIYGKGGWSAIHLLSAFTLVQAPLIAWHAHRHDVIAHRTTVQLIVFGALLIAGVFTLPFGRMLGRWLAG